MDSSRRAVEAYWRSRMIDGVTSDEDKVAPVYKLEEVCDLLRTSHVSIVKEVSDYILKRLDHKSPIVKQKALRLIKYAVGKAGMDFRREMQRHSAVMRQLFHYKGHPDPLKGDALNKAVRDTAHEAITTLFADANNESKAAVAVPTENIQRRIEGFGNTNYEMPSEEKKSFLSEVVGIGLSTIAAANSMRKTDNVGSYRSPNLRRSLTTESSGRDRYERDDYQSENYSSVGSSTNAVSGTWGQDLRTIVENAANNEDTTSRNTGIKSREERLLETIVTSGGVRLQPTRDAIQVFLAQALKLDALAMSHALELKLQSPLWQVRMKACCVLESILRKKDDEHFCIIASYFSENSDSVVKCSQLPQVSLSEKANKVLSLLDGEQNSISGIQPELSNAKPMHAPAFPMPDLIDTGVLDDDVTESTEQNHVTQNITSVTSSVPLIDDLFGDVSIVGSSNNESRSEDDPFADVSFHISEEKQSDDIFAGLTVDDKISETKRKVNQGSGLLDELISNSDNLLQETDINNYNISGKNVHDLMAGLSLNGTTQEKSQTGGLNGGFGSNSFFPMAPVQYNMNMPPNMMFNQAFGTQQMNYGAMGAFIAQQQLLYQNLGNMNSSFGQQTIGNARDGDQSSPLPDIFQPSNIPVQNHAAALANSKKEDTKAFDFISEHVSASRNSKRVS